MAYKFYQYDPSQALAITGVILFLIPTLYHTWQLFRYRAWYFIPFLIGGYFEVFGFITRIVSIGDVTQLGPFIGQGFLLLLPPVLFSASIYMSLKKIIVHLDAEQYSVISITRLTPIFVWLDVIALWVQAGGGGLQAARSASLAKTGQYITIVGLVIHLLSFTFFLTITTMFHSRVKKVKTPDVQNNGSTVRIGWQQIIYALYIAGALIIIRSIYRLVEYAQGHEGYLNSHEVYFYVFDSLLMLFVMIMFSLIYPPQILKSKPVVATKLTQFNSA